MLDEILLPGFEVEFIVETKPAWRRLHDAGVHVVLGDPRRTDTYLKADLTPGTCVIIEDNGRRSLKKILEAVRDAGGTLVYVLGIGLGAESAEERPESLHAAFPDVVYLSMSELFGGPLLTEFSRSLTRAKVAQYQRYFSDAERVLILLHNDPDPDALASGLALRNVLHRTKTTAIIGAIEGVTRPENLRMVNLLDIHVESVTPESVKEYDRVAMVDVQPHYFGGLIDARRSRHRPPPGAAGVHRGLQGHPRRLRLDVDDPDRASAGGRREHLGADRHRDAVRHQVGHAVFQPPDQPRRHRGVLVPVSAGGRGADPEDGGRGNHLRAPRLRAEGTRDGPLIDQVFCAFLGPSPREDFIPYVADFFLQLEDVKWTVIGGIVNDSVVISVRNLGYSRNAGEFVRRLLRRPRQRRRASRHGQGGRADQSVPREIRRPRARGQTSSSCRSWSAQFLHERVTHADARILTFGMRTDESDSRRTLLTS